MQIAEKFYVCTLCRIHFGLQWFLQFKLHDINISAHVGFMFLLCITSVMTAAGGKKMFIFDGLEDSWMDRGLTWTISRGCTDNVGKFPRPWIGTLSPRIESKRRTWSQDSTLTLRLWSEELPEDMTTGLDRTSTKRVGCRETSRKAQSPFPEWWDNCGQHGARLLFWDKVSETSWMMWILL